MRALLLVVLTISLPLGSSAEEQRLACATTTPAGASLGKPFPPSENWYGSEVLAVILPPDGIWGGTEELHYRGKLFWWSYGFEPGTESHLKVSGHRLDATALAANVSRPSSAYAASLGGWAMLVAVEFPSTGCWRISGEYNGQRLSFIVDVSDLSPTPPNNRWSGP
jgi:hypothetical protein